MNLLKKSILLTISSSLLITAGLTTAQDSKPTEDKESTNTETKAKPTIDYKNQTEKLKWRSVNDGVMGGKSEGKYYFSEANNLMFRGEISLKNNGGFASIRSYGEQYDLSKSKGMEVTFRGDGRTYYFTARAGGNSRLAYWSPLKTKAGEWMTVKVPFTSFYATSFGRKIPKLKLNTSKISSFGFMLYDKKDDTFSLEVKSIKSY